MKRGIGYKAKKQDEKQILLRRIEPGHQSGQVYADAKLFIDNLSAFVREGLKDGDSIVIVATAQHLSELEEQLRSDGLDVFHLTLSNQYIPLDADVLLEKFLVSGWPDEMLFRHLVLSLASRALKNDRNIRVYSEMSALLWLKGNRAAAVQLQQIWNKLIQTTTEYDHVTLISEIIPLSSDDDPKAGALN